MITVTIKVPIKVPSKAMAESIDGGPPSQGTPATSTLLVRSLITPSQRCAEPRWAP